MKLLDYPENQEKLIHYVRLTGKLAGAGQALNCSDQNIYNYLQDDLKLKERVDTARDQFEQGEFDDLQRMWNRKAQVYNGALLDTFFAYLTDGEKHIETTVLEDVKKDRDGNILYDEHGNPEFEPDKKITKTYRKPTPKWVIQLAIQLMDQRYDVPDMLKATPQIMNAFVQFIKSRKNLSADGDPMKTLMEAALEFEGVMKKQTMLLKGKKVGQ